MEQDKLAVGQRWEWTLDEIDQKRFSMQTHTFKITNISQANSGLAITGFPSLDNPNEPARWSKIMFDDTTRMRLLYDPRWPTVSVEPVSAEPVRIKTRLELIFNED